MKKNMDFSGKTAVIVCHDAMFGPPHELRDYLLEHNVNTLLFIGHRNRAVPDNHITSSYYEVYRSGKRVVRHVTHQILFPEMVAYFRDSWLTLYWCFTTVRHIDIFVGLGNLNAFAGLILRFFGKASSVIYYVIDYIPDRYGKSVVNGIYRWLDGFCARHAGTWNYAPAMIAAREKDWQKKFPHQLVVPNGIHIRPSVIRPFRNVHKTEIMYLGTLTPQQGAQLMMEALPAVIKEIPSAIFCLIGRGAYRGELAARAKQLGVSSHVRFLGFIEDPLVMERRLSKAALGLATYVPRQGFVQYTEPGKVKRYLAVGVPVVMTDVSPLACEIEISHCGFRVNYSSRALARAVVSFLSRPDTMKTYRKNAVAYAKKSQWEHIFSSAFASTWK